MEKEDFEKILSLYKGQVIKLVYRDGDLIQVIRGRLIGGSDSFVQVDSFNNRYLVRVDDIRKIVSSINQGGR